MKTTYQTLEQALEHATSHRNKIGCTVTYTDNHYLVEDHDTVWYDISAYADGTFDGLPDTHISDIYNAVVHLKAGTPVTFTNVPIEPVPIDYEDALIDFLLSEVSMGTVLVCYL